MWTMTPPVQTSPIAESVRLQAEVNRNRIEFLWTELGTCFALASVAEAKQKRGRQHAVQSLANAEIGYATMVRLMSDPKHSKHITERQSEELKAEMKQLRERLDRLGGRQEWPSQKQSA
jgi:hypothetical protein